MSATDLPPTGAAHPSVQAPHTDDGVRPRKVPRVVILGGGTVGVYTARRLRKRLGKREAAIVVVDPRPYMTYAPFLPEAAAGSIDPRYVVAPHHTALKGIDTLHGKVTGIRHADRKVQITPTQGEPYDIAYDHLVLGLGSIARTLPIPGLAEFGIGFKNIEEAIAIRNHVLGRIDTASSTWDAELRRKMLTFVFVGAGYAGAQDRLFLMDILRHTGKAQLSSFVGRPGIYLEDLFVKPEHRGTGLGRALLKRLAEIAVERECGRLEWAVLDWNEPAIGFYKKLGARPNDEWTVFRLAGEALQELAR